MKLDNFGDVEAFHRKFGMPQAKGPKLLSRELFEFRVRFLKEELQEFTEAHIRGDMVGAFDGLIDLVYVALGTAELMGLPWQPGWDEVQRANMSKERAASSDDIRSIRRSSFDVVKPEGWKPPNLQNVLDRAVAQGVNSRMKRASVDLGEGEG